MSALRRQGLFLACLFALAGVSLVSFQHLDDYSRATRGIALGPDLPAIDGPEVPRLGINAALQDTDPVGRADGLALLADGGYTWIRQPFPWREIEPSKGRFEWSSWDHLVADYLEHGFRLVAVLDRPPDWSREDNNWANRPPDNLADFGAFVGAFAAHYRGRVDHLQIWDEPNVFPNWGNQPIDPSAYVRLLAEAYREAKAANPNATVLIGGLAPNAELGGRNMSDLLFLDVVYEAGGQSFFDIAAAKPYGLWYPPDDRTLSLARANFGRVVLWHEIMAAHGDAAKPVWAVEFGWNALSADWRGKPSLWGGVTEDDQAALTVAALKRAGAEWPWLPVMMLQGYDASPKEDDPTVGFSIVNAAGEPRPVYRAIRDFAARMIAPVGFHAANGPFAQRSSDWSSNGKGLLGNPGGSLDIRFVGDRLDLLVDKGPNGGVAALSLDGVKARRVSGLDGEGLLDTWSSEARTERITVAADLGDSEHLLGVTVLRRGQSAANDLSKTTTFRLEGFYVVREQPSRELSVLGLATLLLALLFGWQTRKATADWPLRPIAGWLESRRDKVLATWRRTSHGRKDLLVFAVIGAAIASLYIANWWLALVLGLLVVGAVLLRPTTAAFGLIATAPLSTVPFYVASAQILPSELLAIAAIAALGGRWLLGWLGDRPWRRASTALWWDGGRPPVAPTGCGEEATNVCRRRHSPAAPSLFLVRHGLMSWAARGFNGPILCLVIASVFATLFAVDGHVAQRELRTVVLEPLILYVLVLRICKHPKDGSIDRALRLIDLLVVVGGVLAAFAVVQYVLGLNLITAEGVSRVRAFYGSPNNLGLLLGRIVPLGVMIGATDQRRRWYFSALLLMAAAIVLTFSIGTWLGVAAAAIFAGALTGLRPALAVAGGLASAGAALFMTLPAERLVSHFSLDRGTTRLRLLIWQSALNMLRDHPVFGVGPDNFFGLYRSQYMLPGAWEEPNLSHPHNLILDFWLRAGLLGAVAGLWLLVRFFAVGLNLFKRLGDPVRRGIVLGLLASMVDFVAHGLIDNSLFLMDLALLFWLLCALLEVVAREQYNNAGVHEKASSVSGAPIAARQ